MNQEQIAHYTKQLLKASNQLSEDEVVLLSHAIAECLGDDNSTHRKIALKVFGRLHALAQSRAEAHSLRVRLDRSRDGASHAFVTRFVKRKYIYENVYHYWQESGILSEDGDSYTRRFPVSAPASELTARSPSVTKTYYLDLLVYDEATGLFSIEDLPEIANWFSSNVEVILEEHNLVVLGRAARLPQEVFQKLLSFVSSNPEYVVRKVAN